MVAQFYANLFHIDLALFAGLGTQYPRRGDESVARLRGARGFFPILLGRLLRATEIRSRSCSRLLLFARIAFRLAAPALCLHCDAQLYRYFQRMVSDEFPRSDCNSDAAGDCNSDLYYEI